MTTSSDPSAALRDEVLHLERDVETAINTHDVATLTRLFGAELTLTHVDGRTEDKDAFLAQVAGAASGPLSGLQATAETTDLTVRGYGEVAVLTGRGITRMPGREPVEYVSSQVWVRRAPSWQLVHFQSTRIRLPRT